MKSSLKISNFSKILERDLKKVNVEPKQILKKPAWYQKREKKSSRNEKKKWQDESDKKQSRKCNSGVVSFLREKLDKIVNLDLKISKVKKMEDSITCSWYKINKCKPSKVKQSKPCYKSRLRSCLCCCKDSKVVYFKSTVLGFVSEIVFNLLVHKKTMFPKILFNFLG